MTKTQRLPRVAGKVKEFIVATQRAHPDWTIAELIEEGREKGFTMPSRPTIYTVLTSAGMSRSRGYSTRRPPPPPTVSYAEEVGADNGRGIMARAIADLDRQMGELRAARAALTRTFTTAGG